MHRSTAATPKARVLPEPVGALATMSRPATASGIDASWMGKGASIPRAERRATRAGATPRSLNEMVTRLQTS